MVDSDAEWSPRLNVSGGGMGTMSLSLLMVGYALLGFELCALESSNHSLTIVRAGPDHVELIYRRTAALMEVFQKT
jgi:hypothetical protein